MLLQATLQERPLDTKLLGDYSAEEALNNQACSRYPLSENMGVCPNFKSFLLSSQPPSLLPAKDMCHIDLRVTEENSTSVSIF